MIMQQFKYRGAMIPLFVREGTPDANTARNVIELDEYHLRGVAEKFTPTTILDIGGHIGSFMALASHLWPKAEIWSYEPDRGNFEMLLINCVGRKGAIPINSAIIGGDPEGWKLQRHKINEGAHRLVKSDDGDLVDLKTIGCVLKDIPDEDILLKIDCEGSERHIFLELAEGKQLNRFPHIVGEYHGFENRALVQEMIGELFELKFLHERSWGTFIAKRK